MGFDDSQQYNSAPPVIVPYPGSGMVSSFNMLDTQISFPQSTNSFSPGVTVHASPIQEQTNQSEIDRVEISGCGCFNPCSLWEFVELLGNINLTIWYGNFMFAYYGTRKYYKKGSLLSMFLAFIIESAIILCLLIGLLVYYLSLGTVIIVFGAIFLLVNIFTFCIPAIAIWYFFFKEKENDSYELVDNGISKV